MGGGSSKLSGCEGRRRANTLSGTADEPRAASRWRDIRAGSCPTSAAPAEAAGLNEGRWGAEEPRQEESAEATHSKETTLRTEWPKTQRRTRAASTESVESDLRFSQRRQSCGDDGFDAQPMRERAGGI